MTKETQFIHRVIRCRIEMELIEGEHFNFNEDEINDANAEILAIFQFADILQNLTLNELEDYIQAKIIKET